MKLNKYSNLITATKDEVLEVKRKPSIMFTEEGCEDGFFKLIHKGYDGVILRIELKSFKDVLST